VSVLGVKELRVFYVYCTNLHIVIILCDRDFSPYLDFSRYILVFSVLILFPINRVILAWRQR